MSIYIYICVYTSIRGTQTYGIYAAIKYVTVGNYIMVSAVMHVYIKLYNTIPLYHDTHY